MSLIDDIFPNNPVAASIPITITDRSKDWSNFLQERYKTQLNKISREYPYNKSLVIDCRILEESGPVGIQLADELYMNPDRVIRDVKDSIKENNLIRVKKTKEPAEINVRFISLNSARKIAIRDIRELHIEEFVSVEGIIRKVNDVRPRIKRAAVRCGVGHLHYFDQGYGTIEIPPQCQTDGCSQRSLKIIKSPPASTFINAQRARIQETPEGLAGGAQPQTIDVDITDDISGQVQAGDRVILNGIIRIHERHISGKQSTSYDIYLECNSIEFPEKDFSEIKITEVDIEKFHELSRDPELRNKVINSVCPPIFGHEDIKEAIALQLFGGIPKVYDDGSAVRGDIHVILIGDPGIAKSKFLKYVTKLSPRSIYVSASSGTTAAGLTATAVKDEFGEGRWTLEAGALVLADMGIACVDEMDKMISSVRASLLEPLEQQTISVAKAGLTVTLKSRCSMLAAANPKYGRFDENVSISDQFNLEAPLLTRFDLIILTQDRAILKDDKRLAEFILNLHMVGTDIIRKIKGISKKNPNKSSISPPIDSILLKKYIAYSKQNCYPVFTEEAKNSLIEFYSKIRGDAASSKDKPVPITARQLEGLVRLSEASARMRLSNEVTEYDTLQAITIQDRSLINIAYDASGARDIDAIVTGMTKSVRNLHISMDHLIRTLPAHEKDGVSEKEVISHLIESGFEERKVIETIEARYRKGELTRPKNDFLKLV